MYVYKTTNNINGKIYIGISKKPSDKNPQYLGSGKAAKRAFEKYGRSNFSKEIIVEDAEFMYQDLQRLEIFLIDLFNSRHSKVGYNISQGGDGNSGEVNGMFNRTHSEESIKSMMDSKREKFATIEGYGKMSDETRKKFGEFVAERNRKSPTLPNGHTEETKKRISKTITRMLATGEMTRNYASFSDERKQEYSEMFKGEKNPFYGKTHTAETLAKIKDSNRKRFPAVNKIDLNGEVVKRYESLMDVYDDGHRPDLVKLVIKGANKLHAGFKWELANK